MVKARSGLKGRCLAEDDEEEEMTVVAGEDGGGCGQAKLKRDLGKQ